MASASSGDLGSSSGDLGSSSGDLGSSSGDLGPSSGDLGPSSGDLGPSSGDIRVMESMEDLPIAEQARIAELVQNSAAKSKHSQIAAEALLLQVCQNHYFSLSLLSEIINKSPDHVRKEILNPLLEKAGIIRAYEQKTHSKQGYRTAIKK